MKRNYVVLILVAAALLISQCSFVTDGNFQGLVAGAGMKGKDILNAPTHVELLPDELGRIYVSWVGDDKADGYTIWRSSSRTGINEFKLRGTTGKTIFVDSGATGQEGTAFY